MCRSASLAASRSARGSGKPASISTCRRQLSTLACSFSCSMWVSVISAMSCHAGIRDRLDDPFRDWLADRRRDGRGDSVIALLSPSSRRASSSRIISSTAWSSSRASFVAASSRISRMRSSNAVAAIWACRSISRSVTRSSRSVWRRSNSIERQLEPRPRVGLGLLDALGDRGLPRPQALRDLLDRAASLDRLRLELVERLAHGRRGCPLELLAQPDHGPPLLVARRAELGRVPVDPRLDLGDRLLLPLRQVGELRLDVTLRSLEVVGDALKSLVETPLDIGERVRERLAGAPLALDERRADAPRRVGAPRRPAARSCRRARARACGGSPPCAPPSPPRRLQRSALVPRRRARRSPSAALARAVAARARGRTREPARQRGRQRESRWPRRNAIGERRRAQRRSGRSRP